MSADASSSHAALTAEQLDALRAMDSCAVSNAIEATGVRLRNEGYMDATVRSLFPDLPPLVGYALPVLVRTTKPPVQGMRYVDSIDWAEQLLALPHPRVLVVQDERSEPRTGSFTGEVHANIYRALGCAGVITNGAVRDLPAMHALSFQAFAVYVSVSHAYVHIVQVGKPVMVGGLTVHTGDLLHADRHGVVSVPLDIAGDLPAIAAAQRQEEEKLIAFCRSSSFSVPGLEQMLRHVQAERPLPD
jgi:regulator of RNase E activity RraA